MGFVLWLAACAPARPAATTQGLGGSSEADVERHETRATEGPGHGLDSRAFERAVAAKVDEVLRRPHVSRAFEELVTGVFDDPALSGKGERFLDSLGDAPELSRQLEALNDGIGELPELRALVERLMSSRPGMTPEAVGDEVGRLMTARFESPTVDRAIDDAIEHAFAQPELDRVFDEFGDAVAENPRFVAALETALREVDEERWNRRLTALNGGKPPDDARVLELLLEHLLTTERLEALLMAWLKKPATRAELVRLCTELLDAPAFRRHAVALAASVLSDPGFNQSALRAFGLLLAPELDERAFIDEVQRLLDTRRMVVAEAAFFRALMSDAELRLIGNRSLARIAESPAFAAEAQRFVTDF